MKIRVIDGIKLQIVEDKEYVYNYLIKYYDMIYKDYDYGCIPIVDDIINLDRAWLVNTKPFYDRLRYVHDILFVDMKTREIMIRI